MNSLEDIKDWRIWIQILKKHWIILFLSILFATATGVFIALTTEPEFESTSSIMILDTDLLSGSSLRFVPGGPKHGGIDYLRQLVKSNNFLLKLKDSLKIENNQKLITKIRKLTEEYPNIPPQDIKQQVFIEHLQDRIRVKVRAYNLIEFISTGKTSDEAYRLCRSLTNLAISEARKEQMQSITEASSFSDQLLDVYRKRLMKSESNLRKFNNNIKSTLFIDEIKLSPEKLNEIQSILLSSSIELQTKKEKLSEINSSLPRVPFSLENNLKKALKEPKKKILQRTESVCQLFKKFSWKDIEIIQLNEAIGRIKGEISQIIKSNISANYPSLPRSAIQGIINAENMKIDILILEKTINSFQNIIKDHNEALKGQPSREIIRNRLEKEVKVNREIYQQLLQQVRGSQIRKTAITKESQMRYKLIQPAQRPLERVKPRRKKILFIALFLGLSVGCCIILMIESLDVSFKNVEQVNNLLNLPVLAAIPKLDKKHGIRMNV